MNFKTKSIMTIQTKLPKTDSFNNLTSDRILIKYWVSIVPGLSSQKCLIIEPNTQVPIPKSNVDEWIVYLEKNQCRIGKFRIKPAYDGERTWNEDSTTYSLECNASVINGRQELLFTQIGSSPFLS